MKKKCIVISGMHRSGTSAIAGVIYNLDIPFGEDLLGAQKENAKGFFESRALVEFNESILNLLNTNWHDLKNIDYTEIFKQPECEQLLKGARLFLKSFVEANDVFALKDPRFCLTLPFWIKVFDSLAIETIYVLSLRAPIEVAESLSKRNKFDLEDGLLLNAKYLTNLEDNVKAKPQLFVNYNELIHQPKKVLNNLLLFFNDNGINITPNQQRLDYITEEFLEKGMNHAQAKKELIAAINPLFSEIHTYFLTKVDGRNNKEQVEYAAIKRNYLSYLNDYLDKTEELIPTYLYYKFKPEKPYSEAKKLIKGIAISTEEQSITFDLREIQGKIIDLRLDLTDRFSVIKINQIEIIANGKKHTVFCSSNAVFETENVYAFNTNDPNIYLDFSTIDGKPTQVTTHFQLLAHTKDGVINYLIQNTQTLNNVAVETKNELQEQRQLVGQLTENLEEKVLRIEQIIKEKEQLVARNEERIQELSLINEERIRQIEIEKNTHINNLNIGLASIQKDYSDLKQSLSNRIGFALTAPFRWLFEILKGIGGVFTMLAFWGSFIGIGIRYFGKFISNINGENYRTLKKALKKESPQLILSNLKKKLTGGNDRNFKVKEKFVDKNNNGFGLAGKSDFKFHYYIENATILNNSRILFKGWAAASNPVTKVTLQLQGKVLEAKYGLPRADVGRVIKDVDNSDYSGFYLSVELGDEIDGETLKKGQVMIENKDKTLLEAEVEFHHSEDYSLLTKKDQYELFLQLNKVTNKEKKAWIKEMKTFTFKPKYSIIVPVYNVDEVWLDACIKSVINQIYTNWELCLYDDCSTKEETIKGLKKWIGKDERIKVKFGKENKNISLASNEAIKMATGEYICLLDHDDEITIDALYQNTKVLNEHPDVEVIYSDEDKIDTHGAIHLPYFKTDFNIDLLRSNNYICHFLVVKRSLGEKINWFRKGFEGSQDHDLVLRLVEQISPDKIYHIPRVLYHWRVIPGSTASEYSEKDYAFEAGKKAIEEHLMRNNEQAVVKKGMWGGAYKVERALQDESKKVSIIIPFKDEVEVLKTCIESIVKFTKYKNIEVLLVSNNSDQPATFKYLKEIEKKHSFIKVLEYNVPFNFSKINNWGVQQATGDYVLFLNNDIEVITKGWLSTMVEHIQRPEVGAVGAKLYYPDDTIQHAGVVLGIGGIAGHAFKNYHRSEFPYFHSGCIRNISACTAACLLVKKSVFLEVGKFNEKDLKVAFNDVDLCLKIRKAGYLIVYTPYAELYHYESKSRGYEDTPEKIARFERESGYMRKMWSEVLDNDPYYNPNLSLKAENYAYKLE